MAASIRIDLDTSGAAVYGTQLRNYAIDGEMGKTFSEVIAFASLRQLHSIEMATSALSSVVRVRQRKVDDLAEVLAVISSAIPSMPSKGESGDRWSTISREDIAAANELLAKYGLAKMATNGDGQINYATAYQSQNDVQLLLDNESNDLQQNMTSLQSLVSKRDNAFSTANKVIQKGNATARATINAFGA